MGENDWTKNIKDRLNSFLNKSQYEADSLVKIPYLQEIDGYIGEKWEPKCIPPTAFETDLVVYERESDLVKPRVIVEAKLGSITTHDAITYSYKADKHKNITPYLRYGIMIGNREHYPLPGRLFRHGTNFDFMFSFTGNEPTEKEWGAFTQMIMDEIEYSKSIEGMLHESRNPDRKRYYMLEKKLVLKEIED